MKTLNKFYIFKATLILLSLLLIMSKESNMEMLTSITNNNLRISTQQVQIPVEEWIYIRSKETGFCLKNNGGNQEIIQSKCRDTVDFQWRISRNDKEETYFIQSKVGNGVVDIKESNKSNGTPIVLSPFFQSTFQKWKISYFSDKNFFMIQNFISTKCIDNQGKTYPEGNYIINDCNDKSKNQAFFFSKQDLIPIITSEWVNIISKEKKYCIKNNGKGYKTSQIYCNDNSDTLWKFERNTDGSYKITSKLDGSVIDNEGNLNKKGNPIVNWSYFGGESQKWEIEQFSEKGYILLVNQGSQKCLEKQNDDLDQVYSIADCNDNEKNQAFMVERPSLSNFHLDDFVYIKTLNNMCINSVVNNQRLLQAKCSPQDSMAWFIQKNDDETVTFVNKGTKMVIDNSMNNDQNRNPIIGWAKNEKNNQRWKIYNFSSKNYFLIQSKGINKCIDNTGQSNVGEKFIIYDCSDTNSNQAFTFDKVPL